MSAIYSIVAEDSRYDTTFQANQFIDQIIRVGSKEYSYILATITVNKFEEANNTQRFDFKVDGELIKTGFYNKKTKEFYF